jgi:hypothetical protein
MFSISAVRMFLEVPNEKITAKTADFINQPISVEKYSDTPLVSFRDALHAALRVYYKGFRKK